jgi:hypothetical protein
MSNGSHVNQSLNEEVGAGFIILLPQTVLKRSKKPTKYSRRYGTDM